MPPPTRIRPFAVTEGRESPLFSHSSPFFTAFGAPMTHPVLTALGLTDNESGTFLGNGQWSATKDAGVIEPVNPTTGEVLGRVLASSQADYDTIIERAQAVYKVWRTTPAPRRGEAIRL